MGISLQQTQQPASEALAPEVQMDNAGVLAWEMSHGVEVGVRPVH